MIQKLDKYVIKAYKHMLLDKLKKPEEWGVHRSEKSGDGHRYEYSCYFSNVNMYLIIKYNNSVVVRITGDDIYTFTKTGNWDLVPKVLRLRKMKKHEDINNVTKSIEDRMRNSLPENYRRSIKISKIKSKI